VCECVQNGQRFQGLFNSPQKLFFGMLVLSPVATATGQRTIQRWASALLRSVTGTDLPWAQGESFPGTASAAAAEDRRSLEDLQPGRRHPFKTMRQRPDPAGSHVRSCIDLLMHRPRRFQMEQKPGMSVGDVNEPINQNECNQKPFSCAVKSRRASQVSRFIHREGKGNRRRRWCFR